MDIVKAIHRYYFWYFLIPVSLLYSQGILEGTVVDSKSNEPVIGANVFIVETDVGVVTDKDGYFKIEWEKKLPVVLQISHIGYITRQLTVSLPKQLKIRLVPKVLRGEEVTILGERSRSQAESSTAIDVIDIEKIELQGARDVGSALRRISSVVIDETSSGAQTVSIRGSNSNEVAVYLDGVKINKANTGIADLSQIDLNSLKRIEVLRGGNTYLFGQGNLGGVLNLETQEVKENGFSVNFSDGLSFEDDQDLSLIGKAVLGPLGIGGQLSGRSRAYEGRTVTSSLFAHVLGDACFESGKLSNRWYNMRNAITFPSGSVALGDLQTITSFRYLGNLWKTTGWDFFGGSREWTETNNFFDNLDQKLNDRNFSYRIGKDFRLRLLDATVQLEYEDKRFRGDRTLFWPHGDYATDFQSEVTRTTGALAGVVRWFTEEDNPILRRLQIEFSGRMDDSYTTRREQQEVRHLDGTTYGIWDNDGSNTNRFFSRRLGLRMEGLTNKFGYRAFFSQGNNRRLPALNDIFLKATTWFDSLRSLPLTPEILNSTELNFQVSFTEFLTISLISELMFTGAYFRNNYHNKIGYLPLKQLESIHEPPHPYNEPKADIRGLEAGVLASFLENKLRFQINYTLLDIKNPFIFPNRPGFRYVTIVDLDLDWIMVSYDFFKEGEQFVMGSFYGRLFEARENANLSITIKKKFFGFNVSLSYIIRNIMSKEDKISEEDFDILFFNYYQQYREIVTLRISL